MTTADGGQILTRSLDAERWVGASTDATPFDVADGDATRPDVDGVERIYGDATVHDLGWRVFAGAGRNDALDGATSVFRRALRGDRGRAVADVGHRRSHLPAYRRADQVLEPCRECTVPSIAHREASPCAGPTEVVAVADEFNALVENLRRELGDRERAEQTARDSERSYRTLFEDNPQPMWIWDVATFGFLAVNDAAVAHYGYSRAEFLAMGIRDIVPAGDGGQRSAELHELGRLHDASLVGPLHHSGPWRHITRDGSEISVEITSHTITFHGRDARFALAVDVTQRLAYEAQLHHLALHDELTGLANRTLLLDRLASALAQAPRHMATVGVLYVDLDHFKPVNDVHGHDAGDALLRSLAARLTETARPGDTVARIGGDEFVVMCPELAGETEAISVAGRIEGVARDAVPTRATPRSS